MKKILVAVVLLSIGTGCSAHESHGATEARSAITVDSVIAGSPAAAAGMKAGDRIVKLGLQDVSSMDDLQRVTAKHEPGDTVPVTVLRGKKVIELSLTFGERPDGGVSIGVRLAITVDPAAEPTDGTIECLSWIETTYCVEPLMRDLGLDLAGVYEEVLACVEHDTQRMASSDAVRYCDNVFKVHCSAIDVLAEIGDAQVERCEKLIEEALGLKLGQSTAWKTCGRHEVFDRYSMRGESSDAKACQAALLEECGTNLVEVARSHAGTPEQREFLDCCSADTLDPNSPDNRCGMIDVEFQRGPCHERPVCVNRHTTEWIDCGILE